MTDEQYIQLLLESIQLLRYELRTAEDKLERLRPRVRFLMKHMQSGTIDTIAEILGLTDENLST